jgi:SAM-dependent methyltransferase
MSKHIYADRQTDSLYKYLRHKHGQNNPRANGYLFQSYFLYEQKILMSEVTNEHQIVVDIGCGSGLMIKPLTGQIKAAIGIDFNEIACVDAKSNDVPVVRGDAFMLPLADETIDMVLNCQFLNQQTSQNTQHLINELHRILRKGGRCVLIWRNHRAMIHKIALSLFSILDKLTGSPTFPYHDNPVDDVENFCKAAGFTRIVKKELVFPLIKWRTQNTGGLLGSLIGASCFIVADK